jgi:arylformamidase
MPRYVDLSHTIRNGLVTLPGMPPVAITLQLGREQSRSLYAAGTEFEIPRIDMIANTGTYLDTPYHRYSDGYDLAGLPLEKVVDLPCEVFHLQDSANAPIPASAFAGRDLSGAAVLVHTGWDRHFGTAAYGEPAPHLLAEAASLLADAGAALVGIDSINVDDMTSAAAGERPAHTILLAAGIPVVEHLTALSELPEHGARFTAVPPKVEAFGTFPVRAFARLP